MKKHPKRLRRPAWQEWLRREKVFQKALSWILMLAVIAPMWSGGYVWASEAEEDAGLCEHHPAHTEECGYIASAPGADCTHVHDESCGYREAVEGTPCTHEHDESCGYAEGVEAVECSLGCEETDEEGRVVHAPECAFREGAVPAPCTHEHNESCGYSEPVEGAPCTHEHDEDCGYAEAVEGAACTFVCEICAADGADPDADPDAAPVVEPELVSDWSWADEEVFVEQGEDGVWGLGVPNVSADAPLTAEMLAELLPQTVTLQTADGGEETAALTWDLSAVPAEGVWEGAYTVTASLPDGFILGESVQNISVLVDLGGGNIYGIRYVPAITPHSDGRRHKFISNWEYVTSTGISVRDENYRYFIDVTVPDISDTDQLKSFLRKVLPTQLHGSGYNTNKPSDSVNHDELRRAGFKPDSDDSIWGEIYGTIEIQWDIDAAMDTLTSIDDSTVSVYLCAQTKAKEGYLFRVNTRDPEFKDSGNGEADSAETDASPEDDDVLNLTVVFRQISLEGHTVTGINPAATTVNLFDYWVDQDGASGDDLLGTTDVHKNAGGEDVSRTGVEDWKKGINKGHLLLFGDGNIHAGYWNKGAGAGTDYGKNHAGMIGLVENNLVNGYPVMNTTAMEKVLEGYEGISDHMLCGDHDASLGTGRGSKDPKNISNTVKEQWNRNASLEYLFKPEEGDFKRFYGDVKGLFQLDDHGYYYYDMRRNYAEFSEEGGNHFILYDAPAVDRTDGIYDPSGTGNWTTQRSVGNFFPFNKGAEVFTGVDEDGKLTSSAAVQSSNLKNTSANMMNHHLGMTVSVNFRQPIQGKINTGSSGQVPMTFQFSGDDDVWVFIDGVLVLDLGGIHSEIFGTIDFSTGEVLIGQSWKTNGFPYNSDGTVNMEKLKEAATLRTNLKELFEEAGKEIKDDAWSGNTFASESNHVLKMFYLERGNYDSSLALRFNLQPQLFQQIKKVDQNGNPIPNVTFRLYKAELAKETDEGAIPCLYTDADINVDGVEKNTPFYVRQTDETIMATLVTGPDGVARFQPDNSEEPFDFGKLGSDFFVLKELRPPEGYRAQPTDIVLHYDGSRNTQEEDRASYMLTVANRWTTGAYACSTSTVRGNNNLTYGSITPEDGSVTAGDIKINGKTQREGLVVAIPMLKQTSTERWIALYGSNIGGFQPEMVDDQKGVEEKDVQVWRDAVLRAALKQMAGVGIPHWYLSWNEEDRILDGTLSDLPGLASRYQLLNPDGDMRMVYAVIEPEALAELGISGGSAEERYMALGARLRNPDDTINLKAVEGAVKTINDVELEYTASKKGFSFLNASQFIRNFRSLIYIPNEQRELWVVKVDEKGVPQNDAVFGLYTDPQCTGTPVSKGTTGTVNGQDGVLIFSPRDNDGDGYAQIKWASLERSKYYLQEISAPNGLDINDTIIPVVVGTYSIYADAGTKEDGVSVMAGVGRLTQTMRQYASDGIIDITLRDITAYGQYQPSENKDVLPSAWQDMELKTTIGIDPVKRFMNLHFGKNAVIDYGLHKEDGGEIYKPFFVTDTGYIRARVEQNYLALTKDSPYEFTSQDANKDNLGKTDLTNLFSLLNIVIVTDQPKEEDAEPTGQLCIRKDVIGAADKPSEADYTKNFTFKISLTNKDGSPLKGEFYFWGTDKAGTLKDGDKFVLHHDEEITIQGLPVGTKYKITETKEDGWYVSPDSGIISGDIEENIEEDIEEDITASAVFTNSREQFPTGSLKIKKTVVGTDEDKQEEFKFTVILEDAKEKKLTGDYFYSYSSDKPDSERKTIRSGGSVTLKDGEFVIITGLPEGTKYTVTEAKESGWTVTPESGTISGNIQTNTEAEASFTNKKDKEPEPGSLTIKKTVTGGSTEQEFTFTVTLTDAGGKTLTDSYPYSGSKEGKIRSGDFVTLKDGEHVTITGLPKGTKYIVTEDEEAGWTVSPERTISGNIQANAEAEASFTNKKDKEPEPGSLTIKKTVEGTGEALEKAFTFTLTLTGKDGNPLAGSYSYSGSKEGKIWSGESVTLKHNEHVTITGLPEGTKYTVTEVKETGWSVSPESGIISGNIQANAEAEASFTNKKDEKHPQPEPGSLTIKKTVTGGSTEKEFTFTVTLTDADGKMLTDSYPYSGSKEGKIRSGESVTLKHSEHVTITGLPAGTRYTVEESGSEGYKVTETGGTGEIKSGAVSEADFTNSRNNPGSGSGTGSGPKPDPKPTPDPVPTPEPKPDPVPPVPVEPERPEEPPEPVEPPENPPVPTPPSDLPTELPLPNDPDAPEEITILEDGVPKTYVRVWDPEEEEWVWIPEDEVPLDMMADTGDTSRTGLWALLAAGSAAGLWAMAPRRKKEED